MSREWRHASSAVGAGNGRLLNSGNYGICIAVEHTVTRHNQYLGDTRSRKGYILIKTILFYNEHTGRDQCRYYSRTCSVQLKDVGPIGQTVEQEIRQSVPISRTRQHQLYSEIGRNHSALHLLQIKSITWPKANRPLQYQSTIPPH